MFVLSKNFQSLKSRFLTNPLDTDYVESELLKGQELESYSNENFTKLVYDSIINQNDFISNIHTLNQMLICQILRKRFIASLQQGNSVEGLGLIQLIFQILVNFENRQYTYGILLKLDSILDGQDLYQLVMKFKESPLLCSYLLLLHIYEGHKETTLSNFPDSKYFNLVEFINLSQENSLFQPTKDPETRKQQSNILLLCQFINNDDTWRQNFQKFILNITSNPIDFLIANILVKFQRTSKLSFGFSDIEYYKKQQKLFKQKEKPLPELKEEKVQNLADQVQVVQSEQAEQQNFIEFQDQLIEIQTEGGQVVGDEVESLPEFSDPGEDLNLPDEMIVDATQQEQIVEIQIVIKPDESEFIQFVSQQQIALFQFKVLFQMNQNFLSCSNSEYNQQEKQVDTELRTFLYEILHNLNEFLQQNFKWLKNTQLSSIQSISSIASRKNGSNESPLNLLVLQSCIDVLSEIPERSYSGVPKICHQIINNLIQVQINKYDYILPPNIVQELLVSYLRFITNECSKSLLQKERITTLLNNCIFKQSTFKRIKERKGDTFDETDNLILKYFQIFFNKLNEFDQVEDDKFYNDINVKNFIGPFLVKATKKYGQIPFGNIANIYFYSIQQKFLDDLQAQIQEQQTKIEEIYNKKQGPLKEVKEGEIQQPQAQQQLMKEPDQRLLDELGLTWEEYILQLEQTKQFEQKKQEEVQQKSSPQEEAPKVEEGKESKKEEKLAEEEKQSPKEETSKVEEQKNAIIKEQKPEMKEPDQKLLEELGLTLEEYILQLEQTKQCEQENQGLQEEVPKVEDGEESKKEEKLAEEEKQSPKEETSKAEEKENVIEKEQKPAEEQKTLEQEKEEAKQNLLKFTNNELMKEIVKSLQFYYFQSGQLPKNTPQSKKLVCDLVGYQEYQSYLKEQVSSQLNETVNKLKKISLDQDNSNLFQNQTKNFMQIYVSINFDQFIQSFNEWQQSQPTADSDSKFKFVKNMGNKCKVSDLEWNGTEKLDGFYCSSDSTYISVRCQAEINTHDYQLRIRSIFDNVTTYMSPLVSIDNFDELYKQIEFYTSSFSQIEVYFDEVAKNLEEVLQNIPVYSQNYDLIFELQSAGEIIQKMQIQDKYKDKLQLIEKEYEILCQSNQLLPIFALITSNSKENYLHFNKLPSENQQTILQKLVQIYTLLTENFKKMIENFGPTDKFYQYKYCNNNILLSGFPSFYWIQKLLARVTAMLVNIYQIQYVDQKTEEELKDVSEEEKKKQQTWKVSLKFLTQWREEEKIFKKFLYNNLTNVMKFSEDLSFAEIKKFYFLFFLIFKSQQQGSLWTDGALYKFGDFEKNKIELETITFVQNHYLIYSFDYVHPQFLQKLSQGFQIMTEFLNKSKEDPEITQFQQHLNTEIVYSAVKTYVKSIIKQNQPDASKPSEQSNLVNIELLKSCQIFCLKYIGCLKRELYQNFVETCFNFGKEEKIDNSTYKLHIQFIISIMNQYNGMHFKFVEILNDLVVFRSSELDKDNQKWIKQYIFQSAYSIIYQFQQHHEMAESILEQFLKYKNIYSKQLIEEELLNHVTKKQDKLEQFMHLFNYIKYLNILKYTKQLYDKNGSAIKLISLQQFSDFNTLILIVQKEAGLLSQQKNQKKGDCMSGKIELIFKMFCEILTSLIKYMNGGNYPMEKLFEIAKNNLISYSQNFDQRQRQNSYNEKNFSNKSRYVDDPEFIESQRTLDEGKYIKLLLVLVCLCIEQNNQFDSQLFDLLQNVQKNISQCYDLQMIQIFSYLFERVLSQSMSADFMGRNVELYEKLKLCSDFYQFRSNYLSPDQGGARVAGSEYLSFIEGFQSMVPQTTKLIQKNISQNFQTPQDFTKTYLQKQQNSEDMSKVIGFLINNYIDQLELEYQKDGPGFVSILDSYVTSQILRVIAQIYPKLVTQIMNYPVPVSRQKIISNPEQDLVTFYYYVLRQDGYSYSCLDRLGYEVPSWYIFDTKISRLQLSTQYIQNAISNQYEEQIFKSLKTGIKTNKEYSELNLSLSQFLIGRFEQNIKDTSFMSSGEKLQNLQQDVIFFDNFYKNLFQHLTNKDFQLYVNILNKQYLNENFKTSVKKLRRYICKFQKDDDADDERLKKKQQKLYLYYKYFKNFEKNIKRNQILLHYNSPQTKDKWALLQLDQDIQSDVSLEIPNETKGNLPYSLIISAYKQIYPDYNKEDFLNFEITGIQNQPGIEYQIQSDFKYYWNKNLEIFEQDQQFNSYFDKKQPLEEKIKQPEEKQVEKSPDQQLLDQPDPHLLEELGLTREEYFQQNEQIKQLEQKNEETVKQQEAVSQDVGKQLINKSYVLNESQNNKKKIQEVLEKRILNVSTEYFSSTLDTSRWYNPKVNFTESDIKQIHDLYNKCDESDKQDLQRRLPSQILEKILTSDQFNKVKDWQKRIFPIIKYDKNLIKRKSSEDDNQNVVLDEDDQIENEQQEIFHGQYYNQHIENLLNSSLNDQDFFEQMPAFSDEGLSCLIFATFYQKNDQNIQSLKKLCMNPHNCYRIIDALTFILMLDNEDFIKLEKAQHPISYLLRIPKNDKYIKENNRQGIVYDALFVNDQFLQKLQCKWGNFLFTRGIFSKLEKIKFLKDDYKQNEEEIAVQPLKMVESARDLLSEDFDVENPQMNYFSLLVTYKQNCPDIWQSLEVLGNYGKVYIPKVSEEEKMKYKQKLKQNQQVNNIYKRLHYYSKTNPNQEYINEKAAKVSKKPLWPFFDLVKIFKASPFYLTQYAYSMVELDIDYMKECFTEFLQQNSDEGLLQTCISSLFEISSKQVNQQMDKLFEVCENFKSDFYKKNRKLDPKKSLQEQNEQTWTKTQQDFLQLTSSECNSKGEVQKNITSLIEKKSKSIWAGVNYLIGILEQIYKILYKVSNIEHSIQTEIQNLKQTNQVKNQREIDDLDKKIKELNKKKRLQKNQLKETIYSSVRQVVINLPNMNMMYRNYVEFVYFVKQFLGFDSKCREKFEKLQTDFRFLNTSLILLSSKFNISDQDSFLDNEEDEIDLQEIKLSKMYTSEKSFNSQLNTGNIKRQYTTQTDKKDFNLCNTYDLIFGKPFYFFKDSCSFCDNNLYEDFKFFSIFKVKEQGVIPVSDKLSVIKDLSIRRANKDSPEYKSGSITVSRNMVWSSTVKNLLEEFSPQELVTSESIKISFEGERGFDMGGLKNEWLTMLTYDVFDPQAGLFTLSANKASIQPSPLSYLVPNHLLQFRYLGRLVAKALIENWYFEVSFAKSFLKHILGLPIYVEDIEDIDESLKQSFKWTLKNDITEDDCLSYTQNISFFGQIHEVGLIPNGQNINITNINKKDYIKALARAKMTDNIQPQAEAFKQGIHDIIPPQALNILNEKELGLHLAGMPIMNIDELEQYLILDGYGKNDPTIKYFFEVLRAWDDTMKANLLFFYSGSFKIPIEGFKRYPLKLTKLDDIHMYPIAHTCFFQIELPAYTSAQMLKEKFEVAFIGGTQGFFIM